jgi:SSS family solute:Na+ symporter
MNDPVLFGIAFWGFLILYGVGMYALSPRAVGHAGFFQGHDSAGRPAGTWALGASIFISWIFAKSITNAANLGATYGVVGGLAYATYWLSIPLAGWAILRLRQRYGATSLMSFLTGRYGRLAALAFSLAILVRLFNEVWSNTSVVGGYYGEAGSAAFIGSALLFTAATLFYSLKGGLRSSIYTDVLQTVLFIGFFAVVLLLVLPEHGPVTLMSTGDFRLDAGLDLLLVAALQILSYPFHDPVLTDRGFITDERRMLRAFVWAGLLGFICILLFSLVGVHARLEGLAGGDNVPAALARSMGPAALFVMTIVMVAAAGSTLDSTFSSLARHVAQELPQLAGRPEPKRAIALGMATWRCLH